MGELRDELSQAIGWRLLRSITNTDCRHPRRLNLGLQHRVIGSMVSKVLINREVHVSQTFLSQIMINGRSMMMLYDEMNIIRNFLSVPKSTAVERSVTEDECQGKHNNAGR